MNSIGNNIEIIRFKVNPEKSAAFVAAREQADKDVSNINGFIGSELCRLDEENWVIFIRWKNSASTKAAQQITESLQSITDWIAIAEQFVSFETAEVIHTSADKM